MNKNISSETQSPNFVWKPEAGRKLLYCLIAVVIVIQIVPQVFGAMGIQVPWRGRIANQTYTYFIGLFVMWHGTITKGFKRALIGFLILFFVGFLMEGLGVNHGLIYGPYHYADSLPGVRVWGVPVVVPVQWELNMYPAFYLACYLLPTDLISKNIKRWQKVVFAFILVTVSGALCTIYDFIADPVYCEFFESWVWHLPGDFFSTFEGGIPLLNYIGWLITGIIGSIFYLVILESTPAEKHVKSDYLNFWIPLVMYLGAFIMPVAVSLRFLHNNAVILLATGGMGLIMLLALGKYLFAKYGYTDQTYMNYPSIEKASS